MASRNRGDQSLIAGEKRIGNDRHCRIGSRLCHIEPRAGLAPIGHLPLRRRSDERRHFGNRSRCKGRRDNLALLLPMLPFSAQQASANQGRKNPLRQTRADPIILIVEQDMANRIRIRNDMERNAEQAAPVIMFIKGGVWPAKHAVAPPLPEKGAPTRTPIGGAVRQDWNEGSETGHGVAMP